MKLILYNIIQMILMSYKLLADMLIFWKAIQLRQFVSYAHHSK
jgi:hypothetical protein